MRLCQNMSLCASASLNMPLRVNIYQNILKYIERSISNMLKVFAGNCSMLHELDTP